MAAEGGPSIRKRVLFSGRVQGVCFRATTLEISRGRNVAGFVRNLPDGRVELEAQGDAAEVAQLLADVRRSFEGNITDEQESVVGLHADETAFEILY